MFFRTVKSTPQSREVLFLLCCSRCARRPWDLSFRSRYVLHFKSAFGGGLTLRKQRTLSRKRVVHLYRSARLLPVDGPWVYFMDVDIFLYLVSRLVRGPRRCPVLPASCSMETIAVSWLLHLGVLLMMMPVSTTSCTK